MKVDSLTCITGNKHKAAQIEKYLQIPIEIIDLDLIEVQELDPEKVAEHKIREAYKIVQKPLIVDDNGLTIHSMGRLPGTLIKFFESELGYENICRLIDPFKDRSATAFVAIGYFDGEKSQVFLGEIKGSIADHPRGEGGFGWDRIFVPEGFSKTRSEMDEKEYDKTSPRKKALDQLLSFLRE